MSSAAPIQLRDVQRIYATPAGLVRAVDGVDLDIAAGSTVSLVGPSGCGKSTLLGLVGGLERATSGSVTVGGVDIGALDEAGRAAYRRASVGFIFQAYDLLPFLTVVENVALQAAISDVSGGDSPARLLQRVGLEDQAGKFPDQLSGGQKQRVGIARCLAHRPGLILADEPTGELDTTTSREVMGVLLEATADLGATLLLVTHDPLVAGRCERVVALLDGRVTSDTGRAGEALHA